MASETILNGRYRLIAQQGSGGMSVIYKAKDLALGRTVAIKILRPSLTSDPAFLEKFRNEARAVANLMHPNIVTVYDVGSDGPTHFIVMEMVEGTDLKKIVKDHGALSVDRAIDLSIQICAGLGYAHRSGLVHADVKPQNMLVTPEYVVKVTDFGIAQALHNTQPNQQPTKVDVVWGSPHYFAPEQARGEQPTRQADVYAVGIVIFEMLTGELPYMGNNQQELALAHIREPIPNINERRSGIPERLGKIIYRAMAKDPRDRYRDADQMGNILREFRDRARDMTAVAPQVPEQPTPPKPPQVTQPSRQAPGNRPPGVGANASTPPYNSEATAKYSAAPDAPNTYDPRKQSDSVVKPAQPFQQNYIPAPPQQQAQQAPYYGPQPQQGTPYPQTMQNPNLMDSGGYPPQVNYPSQAMLPVDEEEGFDYVTIALGMLAVMAVGGLIILWIFVISTL
ncbi:MAG: protein kinase domain-containing protein [Anaerolineae bacterium]